MSEAFRLRKTKFLPSILSLICYLGENPVGLFPYENTLLLQWVFELHMR